jgi:cell division protease FtsH
MGTPGTPQRAVHEGDGDSEQFRRVRDEEQQELAYEAQRAANTLLSNHREKLDEIAEQLLTHEVLEREQLDTIMRGVPRMARKPGVGLRVVAAVAHKQRGAAAAAADAGEEDPAPPRRGSVPPPSQLDPG